MVCGEIDAPLCFGSILVAIGGATAQSPNSPQPTSSCRTLARVTERRETAIDAEFWRKGAGAPVVRIGTVDAADRAYDSNMGGALAMVTRDSTHDVSVESRERLDAAPAVRPRRAPRRRRQYARPRPVTRVRSSAGILLVLLASCAPGASVRPPGLPPLPA